MSFDSCDKNRINDVKNIDIALNAAKRFVEDDTGVYLYGAAGQGKTHLLVSALRDCVMQGKSVKLLRYSSELKNSTTIENLKFPNKTTFKTKIFIIIYCTLTKFTNEYSCCLNTL